MENQNLQAVNLKKTLITGIFLLMVSIFTFIIELQVNKFQIQQNAQILNAPAELGVSYQQSADGSNLINFDSSQGRLPTYFRANENLTMEVFGSTFITMSAGTEFRTLIFTKNKLHLQLVSGEAILDNRLSQKPITIQTNNVLVKPFNNGEFYFSKSADQTSIQSITGQAIIGIYSERGNLQNKILLAKSNQLNFEQELDPETSQPEPNTTLPDFYRSAQEADLLADLDQELDQLNLLNLTYKGRDIDPTQSTNILPGLTKALTFNNKKRDYLKLDPFAAQLSFAQESYLADDEAQGSFSIKQAEAVFDNQTTDSPTSLRAFKNFVTRVYPSYLSLNSDEKLNPLKIYLVDNHLNLIDNTPYLEAILSYLEDADLYYQKGSIIVAEETIDKVSQLTERWSTTDVENYNFVLMIIDNLLRKNPRSNYAQAYQLRQIFAERLEDSSDLLAQYEATSTEHLERLQFYFENKTIPNSDIQESATLLMNEVSEFDKLQFEDFIEDVNRSVLE